jgi:nucleotide-binding universal stress UspA family protein
MPLKDILVHVDTGPHCAARLEAAIALAAAHDAHLTGLYLRNEPHVPPFVRAQFGPQVTALQNQYANEARAQAEAMFEARLRPSGLGYEWRATEGEAYDMLALNARYADLTVLGQPDPASDEEERPLPDHLVLDAGRPVLVVPYAGVRPARFDKVVVAWNGSRESTRAVNDALPILRQARTVIVLAVDPVGGIDGHGEVPGADLSLHLARHGITAEAQQVAAEEMNVGEALLARCADQAADLLVMGAYGRSRVRELVLGGATQYVLGNMTQPVLMSH